MRCIKYFAVGFLNMDCRVQVGTKLTAVDGSATLTSGAVCAISSASMMYEPNGRDGVDRSQA
jgi:hypothetical protein